MSMDKALTLFQMDPNISVSSRMAKCMVKALLLLQKEINTLEFDFTTASGISIGSDSNVKSD